MAAPAFRGRGSIRRAVLGSILLVTGAQAQTGVSVLTGTVIDASTRQPVPDVAVTATSPSLQGEQVVVTDRTGLYRVPQLPPGTYTLRFEKEAYRPLSRSGIDVSGDQVLRFNVELLPDTAGAETITVVGTPPTVDIGSSAIGTTVTQDFINNLPVARPGGLGGANRSFESLATTAPQVTADYYGAAFNGASSPENLFLINGISVNNPGFGTLGTPLTAEFMDEVRVVTGGYMPEYGRTTGGVVSAVTRSGGNEFHGSVFGTFTPGALAGQPAAVFGSTRVIQGTREVGNLGDIGATLGGYIVQDRLWFFAGIQWSAQRYVYTRSFNRLMNGQLEPIPDSTQRRNGDERGINYIGKLTYLISSDHRVSLSVFGTPTTGGGNGEVPLRNRSTNRAPFGSGLLIGGTFNSAANVQTKFDSLDIAGEVNSAFLDKRLLLEVRLGAHFQHDSYLPGDGSGLHDIENPSVLAGVPRFLAAAVPTPLYALDADLPSSVRSACAETGASCDVLGYGTGGPGHIETLDFESYQARAVLAYLLNAAGHHVLKAGFDGQINKYTHDQTYSGGASYADAQGSLDAQGNNPLPAGTVYETRRYGYLSDTDVITDTLRIRISSKSTILGGFIQDSWSVLDKVTLNLGIRYDTLTHQASDGKIRLSLADQLSPRLGAVWDPTQQGHSKLFANYGRYYEYVPLDVADRSLSGVEAGVAGIHDCDPLAVGRKGCDARTRTDGSNYLFGVTVQSPDRKWVPISQPYAADVDPHLKSPASDEVVAGAEYELFPNARVALTYTYRNLVRMVEDMSANDAVTYFIGNPGEGIANTFPKATRTYHAVTALFARSFSDHWLAQASYTWARLRGNFEGLFDTHQVSALGAPQLDPNINATFDLRNGLLNQTGALPSDITHTIKVYLAKEIVLTPVFGTTLGGSFTASSGAPINMLGASPFYGPVYILEQGSAGRLPWVTSFDARIGLNYRLGKDSVVTAAVEAFNLFNSQRPVGVNENYIPRVVTPILGATQGSVPTEFGGVCANMTGASCAPGNGSLPRPRADPNSSTGLGIRVGLPDLFGKLSGQPTNLSWGKPTNYQPVRQFRFSLRTTF